MGRSRDISAWLDEIGLGHYAEALEEQGVDVHSLHTLGESDLEELGLSFADRRHLTQALARLPDGAGIAASSAADGHKSPPAKPAESRIFTPLMSGQEKAVFACLALAWAVSLVLFWIWWLRPEHVVDGARHLINSLVLFWATIIPGYFIVVFARSRRVDPTRPLPAAWRVAMVVTKAPPEPASVVQRTLLAMLAQRFPHDTWRADEDPTDQMRDWCDRHGVHISTRNGVASYHRKTWPRRTRCKEGNLAFFYDMFGFDNYDFVVQLDADHVPEDGYLEAMLRPFLDPAIGYVSAPSICDSNASESWSARGRLHVEGALHGALQAGHGGNLAPLCIGSHYAVRTSALKAVGGLGPELAEDHSTTLILNAGGWRGAHALDAIAHGEGPACFRDLAVQEYQWSRSLVTILLRYMPSYVGGLPFRLKAQFLFAQAWYPLFAISMLMMVLIPIVAILTRTTWANVIYLEFFIRSLFVTLAIVMMMAWLKSRRWFRPVNAKVLSWEGTLFLFARWPWVLLGTMSAFDDWIRGRTSRFLVTPKGADLSPTLPIVLLVPYLAISVASSLPLVLVEDVNNATGFYVFGTINGILYLGVALAIVLLHSRETRRRSPDPLPRAYQHRNAVALAFVVVLLIDATGASLRFEAGLGGILWGAHAVLAEDSAGFGALASDGVPYLGVVAALMLPFLIRRRSQAHTQRALRRRMVASLLGAMVLIVIGSASLRWGTGLGNSLWGTGSFFSSDCVDTNPPAPSTRQPTDSPTVRLGMMQKFGLGVYDPGRSFADTDGIGIEHVFLSWLDDNAAALASSARYARSRNRVLVVTVEPFPVERPAGDAGLLKDIEAGRYDANADKICGDLASLNEAIFVRWGHEMEAVTGRYPWAQADSASFVRAYRHFVDRCRRHSDRLFYVWSPRGESDLDKYYPGHDYVDNVGLSIFSLPVAELARHGYVRPFSELFGEKYDRVKRYPKPVMVAELGVLGDAKWRHDWLARAFSTLYRYPKLQAIMYFNAKDSPEAWDRKYGIPDWRIEPQSFMTGPAHRISCKG